MENNKNAVAIIGMSGIFPEADTIDGFYQHLKSGHDSVRELSRSRMIHSCIDPNGHYMVTAHMDRVDFFDHKFFDLSKKEADLMDPEQRISLELACQAIENAGYSLKSLEGSNTAVYLGSRPSSAYGSLIEEFDAVAMTGNLSAVTAGRIAYYLNLTGPAMMIDTTCSSSLVAVYEACQKLINEEVSFALAGGIFVIISFPQLGNNISQVGILSPDGRSKTFDAAANGTGGGEGGGMILMKRLDKALEDGDTIHAIIKGGALNHDGRRSTGLTAPSPIAQSEVLKRAWKNATVNPESVTFIEAHGTGTKLGDPIEFQGISDAFREHTDKKKFCAVSSVKTNIGHLNNAAGIAGLIKCVLSLKHKELFPSLHFHQPNPFINFENSAAYVNPKFKKWEYNNGPRRCGISSFGLSGTNAHLVLEENPHSERRKSRKDTPGFILKVSAKSATACLAYLKQIKSHIATSKDALHNIVATLNCGRDDYAYRLAFAGANKEQILHKLTDYENANSELASAGVTEKKLVFLFSNSPVEEIITERLSSQYPSFRDNFNKINKKISEYPASEALQLFAYQYALFHLLQSFGLSANTIVGTGVGKVTKQIIVDGLPVDEAIDTILNNDLLAHPLDENKYLQAVKSMVNSQQVIFVEVGSEGILSGKLDLWRKEIPQIIVHRLVDVNGKLSIYEKVALLYEAGASIAWDVIYPSKSYYKVEAPTYPFDRISCWVQPVLQVADETTDVQNWLYKMEWVEDQLTGEPKKYQKQVFLLMMDEEGLGDEVYRQLSAENTCIRVSRGGKFRKLSPYEYVLDFKREGDYERLRDSIKIDFSHLDGILDFTFYKKPSLISVEVLEELLQQGVYANFFVLKTFSAYFRSNFLLSIVTSEAYPLGDKNSSSPAHSISAAILKGAMAEYPMLDAHHIDLEYKAGAGFETTAQEVLKEITARPPIRFVAYRNAKRFVQRVLQLPQLGNSKEISWKKGGTYLISGGARGIGFEVAKMLASEYQTNLILLGRTALPDGQRSNGQTNERMNEILENIQALERFRGNVSYHGVDISDFEQLKNVFDSLSATVKNIDGVIHAAGVPGNWDALKDKKQEDFRATVLPKIYGTVNLDQLSHSFNPDFFIAFSSLNSIVAQRNSADYAVANAFLDTYATYSSRKNKNFITINWPGWYQTGMSLTNGNILPVGDQPIKPIGNKDGIAALNHALEANIPNLLVGNVNLKLFRINPFFLVQEPGLSSFEPAVEYSGEEPDNKTGDLTPMQSKIRAIWIAVLNEDNFSLEDDFFEIGGHSLNGMQVINRIHEEIGVEMEVEDLFDYATVKDLSEFIEGKLTSGSVNKFESIPKVPESDHYELTHAQRRLWVLNQLEKNSSTYNMPLAFVLEGLDEETFEKAFYKLVERHESFRTAFVVVNGEPRQKIIPFGQTSFKISYEDAGDLAKKELQQQVDKEASLPFDLEKGELLRVKLFRIGDNRHILAFTIHHIISDGWSMRLIVNELTSLYNAFRDDQADPLPKLQIQYKDFARWQNEHLSDENIGKTRDYWLEQFKGDIPKLDLPTDYPRPAVRSFDGDMYNVIIPKELVQRLNNFNTASGTSLYMNLLTVLYILLYRYTGQSDFVVGSPILGRPHKDLEGIVGFFLNNLSLRMQVERNDTFNTLLKRVKNLTLSAYEHQNYPFDRLVDDLNMQIDRSRHPLFDIVLTENVDLTGSEEVNMNGVTIDQYNTGFRSNMVDLRIIFSKGEEGLLLSFDYNKNLFAKQRIKQMAVHFENMLSAAVDQEHVAIAHLDYLSEQEKSALIEGQGFKKMNYPTDKTLYHLFEDQVKRTPDAIALITSDKTYTYCQLNEKANQLAHFLIQNYQVKPDQVIGLSLERSEYVTIGMLGVLKSGAAFLPIDPSLPLTRKELLFSEAGVEILLIDSGNMLEIGDYQGQLVALDIQLPTLDTPASNPQGINSNAHNLAYVIYTSGSSGTPKGVLIEHSSIVNIVLDHVDQLEITKKDRILQFASISFDVSVCETFMALLSGASLALPSTKMINDHEALLNYMDQRGVTIGVFTASVYHVLDLKRLKKLRAFIIGGEAPEPSKIIFSSKYSTMLNAYGPTECAVCITSHRVSNKDKKKVSIPIGKPIANTKILLLDDNQQLVPTGIKGEIYAAGAGLARGYLNDPQLTNEKFITNPFDKNERLYKTGDEGCWSFDKELRIFGRSDQQVKIRGHRVELGEIEKALITHPQIDNGVVMAKKERGEEQLVAFYCFSGVLETNQLKAFLSARLPYYMVPNQYVHINEIPRTTNGKVDSKKLLALHRQSEAEHKYVAPENETQKKLAAIWEEVLGRKEIGIEDNFFELGGHSLKATQVTSRIIEVMNSDIEVGDVFTYPTIRELAGIVGQTTANGTSRISRVPEQAYYEVSHAQKRLWILNQFEENATAYNLPVIYQFKGHLDVDALAGAFSDILHRHEILRTTFILVEEQPMQKILEVDSSGFTLELLDASHSEERESDIENILRHELVTPFDMENGPLFRVKLLKVDNNCYHLVITVHHIIADAWSLGVLIKEITTFYNARVEGKAPEMPSLNIQYKDYAAWQNRLIIDNGLESDRQYWHDRFQGELPVLELLTDYPRPAVQTYDGKHIKHVLGGRASEGLRKFSKDQKASLFITLLAAFKALCYRYTGDKDIIIGTPIAGRNYAELENQVGFYVNTLAIRTQLTGEQSFDELHEHVKKNLLDAQKHQLYPFDKLVEELDLARDASRTPLFNVMLDMHVDNVSEVSIQLNGVEVAPVEADFDISKFDLSMTFVDTGDRLSVNAEYNTNLFKEESIVRMLKHYEQLVMAVLADSRTKLDDLVYTTPAEVRQLRQFSKRINIDYDSSKTLHQLFEEQVKASPKNIALIFEGLELSYAHLNDSANRFANYLIRHHQVQDHNLVAILLSRSEQLVIAILGILKAGAAYLPLDPETPAQRVMDICDDSNAKLLITDEDLKTDNLSSTRIVYLSEEINTIEGSSKASVSRGEHSDIAYCIYTSGSTGSPKGICVPHSSIVNYCEWANRFYFNDRSGYNFPLFTPVSFDLTLTSIFTTLLRGDSLIIYKQQNVADLLMKICADQRINAIKLTPSHIDLLASLDISNFKIACAIVGGEALSSGQLEIMFRLNPGINVYNEYGPTEATVGCTVKMLREGEAITIGKPIDNVNAFILDQNLNATPVGVKGELYIGGDSLAAGYLNSPELTAEKFITNPKNKKELLYRTGDIVNWTANGEINFVGRADTQQKVRGYRIELGEIEQTLLRLSEVDQAIVVVEDKQKNESHITAFLKLTRGSQFDAGKYRTYLSSRLPGYMVPAFYIQLTEVPLTSNAKIDYKALQRLERFAVKPAGSDEATTELQVALIQIWKDVLELDHIGIHDNFFQIGGHSLKAIQATTRIGNKLDMKLSLSIIFRMPTIADLSEELEVMRWIKDDQKIEVESHYEEVEL